jgi:hypothetical protein
MNSFQNVHRLRIFFFTTPANQEWSVSALNTKYFACVRRKEKPNAINEGLII